MEEEENMSPPFWLQASNSFRQSNHRSSRLGRSASSVFFSSGAFVFALIVIALVFIFFVIPSLLSFTSQIFRPHLVKKSWDSLNLVLVLFAIVCGFLSRNSGNDNNVSSPMSYDVSSPQKFEKSNPSTPRQWYDQYSDRSRTVDNQSSGATSTMDRGVRTSSSYPDLRQQEPSWNVVRDERWRSHDDTHVAGYRIPGSDPQHQLHRRHRSWHEEPAEVVAHEEPAEVLTQEEPAEVLAQEEPAEVQARVGCVLRTKNIPVNTFVIPAEQVSSSHAQIQVSACLHTGKLAALVILVSGGIVLQILAVWLVKQIENKKNKLMGRKGEHIQRWKAALQRGDSGRKKKNNISCKCSMVGEFCVEE